MADRPNSLRQRANGADIRRIENAFHTNPMMSMRIPSNDHNISVPTVHDVLSRNLKMFAQNIFTSGHI